jgi:hypothetical protein
MDRVDALIGEYRRQLALPWRSELSGAERIWMAVYPPELERRIRARIADFEFATREGGHEWLQHDVTTAFSDWLAGQEYRDSYYADPTLLAPALPQFLANLETDVTATLTSASAGQNCVVGLIGVGSLFPMVRVSDLVQHIADRVHGRLLVLFPGSIERGNYRLLDARDGWNYLAIPITIPEGASR